MPKHNKSDPKPIDEKEKERIDNEVYLERLRELIKEDRKAQEEKNKINGQEIEKSVTLIEPSLIPLVGDSIQEEEYVTPSGELVLKIVYNTESIIISLKESATMESLKKEIETRFRVKKFRMYAPPRGELSLSNPLSTLVSKGISHMDVIHICKV